MSKIINQREGVRMQHESPNVSARTGKQVFKVEEVRRSALGTGPIRDALERQHPLLEKTFRVETAAFEKAYRAVLQLIQCKEPVAMLVGPTRSGMSTTMAQLHERISLFFPDLPTGMADPIPCDEREAKRGSYDMLRFFGDPAACLPRQSGRHYEALSNWAQALEARGLNRFLLFIDEADELWTHDFLLLAESIDFMRERNIDLQIVFLGSPDLFEKVQGLENMGRSDLVQRFFASYHWHSGVCSLRELAMVLRQYDSPQVATYPPRSGISMSEFWMPKAVKHGWALEQEAPALWLAFRHQAGVGKGAKIEVGMPWVTNAILGFLLSQTERDRSAYERESDAWDRAVAMTGWGAVAAYFAVRSSSQAAS